MCFKFLNLSKYFFFIFIFLTFNYPSYISTLRADEYNNENIRSNKNELNLINKNRYLLAAGDVLSINFIDVKDFSGEYIIMPDGTINLPLIGIVEADFISIEELTNLLTSKFSKQLIRPELFITLKKRRDIRVSIIGEVNKPGLFNLNSSSSIGETNNFDSFPTVVDAISEAGGINSKSDLSAITIKRRLPGKNINYKKTTINLIDLLIEGDQSQNLILFDGDIVKIKEVKPNQIISSKILKLAKANLSPDKITINVIGAVENPGEYEIKPNTPLVKGILLANGLTPWEANINNVELLRINSNGSISVRKYKFNIKEKVSEENNPPLLDGDLIRVNSTKFSKFSGGIKTLTSPFADLITSYSFFKLISD